MTTQLPKANTLRVTINSDDQEIIKVALIKLHESSIVNPKIYPEYALASKQRMYQLMAKLGIAYEANEL
jgi:hypothetical protein